MTVTQLQSAARLWGLGQDTLEIAQRLGVRESVVFNHLSWIAHGRRRAA